MSGTSAVIDVGEIDPRTGRPKLSWCRDTEIWAPCRLGEAFTLREFDHESTRYLYSMKASWMGEHGDGACARSEHQLEGEYVHPIRVGITPRPWGCCWTYEPKIKITPPVWCWEMQEDTMFGLELEPKRNGSRRKARLDCVMIHKGRPVYCIVVETSDGESRRYYDSIPVLDPYFAPIWPATADEPETVAEPAAEPVADPVAETLATVGKAAEPVVKPAETVIETPETVTNAPETVTNAPEPEQTPDSQKSTDVANLPSLANCPERDTAADLTGAATYAVGGIIPGPCLELEADPGELIVPADQLRRVLTTSNAADIVAAYIAQADEDTPASWTGTENRPPVACIGGQTPINGNYYYYVWFEDLPAEGETYEQKAGP